MGLIVVSGPSGSGKTTIIGRLLDLLDLDFSVSATTRAPRPGERDGIDYHFVTKEEFSAMRNDGSLLEWAVYNGNCYGTPAAPIDDSLGRHRDVLLDIEILGARQVRGRRPDATMIFIAPPSLEELESRLRGRGDTAASDILGRLEIARVQMEEAEELFDHIVVNEDLSTATAEVANLIMESR